MIVNKLMHDYIKIIKYRFGDSYRKLKNNNQNPRLILLGTPEYPNLGDHAIALAELNYINGLMHGMDCIEVTQEQLKYDYRGVFKRIQKSDVLLYTGGGFIGSLYLGSGGGLLRKVLKCFPNNKIIIFPSTCYYEDTLEGLNCFKEDISIWQSCKDLHLFIRDSFSWDRVNGYQTEGFHIYQVPDMAYLLNYDTDVNREGVLCIMRSDKEKNTGITAQQIQNVTNELGYNCTSISTRLDHLINPRDREVYLFELFNTMSSAQLIVTDRLHGMILSTICGTPCIAVDNISKKLSGALNVYKHAENVFFTTEKEMGNTIKRILGSGEVKHYHHNVKPDLYKELTSCLKKI